MQVKHFGFMLKAMNSTALSYARHSLITQHNKLRDLRRARSGIIIKKGFSALSFCARLARLLQDIAHEKLEALRLFMLVDHFEQALRSEKTDAKKKKASREKRLALGQPAVSTPHRPKQEKTAAFMAFLLLMMHTQSPKK